MPEDLKSLAEALLALPDESLVHFYYSPGAEPGWWVRVRFQGLGLLLSSRDRADTGVWLRTSWAPCGPGQPEGVVAEFAARVRASLARFIAGGASAGSFSGGVAAFRVAARDTLKDAARAAPPPSRVWKLTDADLRSFNGFPWVVGVPRVASGHGALCDSGWLHYYHHPLLAAALNPVHADIPVPVLWEAEAAGRRLDDYGLKGGCTRLTLLRRVELPALGLRAVVLLGLLARKTLGVYEDDSDKARTADALDAWLASPGDRRLYADALSAARGTRFFLPPADARNPFSPLGRAPQPEKFSPCTVADWWCAAHLSLTPVAIFCSAARHTGLTGTPVDVVALADEAMKAPPDFT
jgi:hypothetical protein